MTSNTPTHMLFEATPRIIPRMYSISFAPQRYPLSNIASFSFASALLNSSLDDVSSPFQIFFPINTAFQIVYQLLESFSTQLFNFCNSTIHSAAQYTLLVLSRVYHQRAFKKFEQVRVRVKFFLTSFVFAAYSGNVITINLIS